MGAFTSALAIGMQVAGGFAQARQAQAAAEYNARIYEQQASLTEAKRKLTTEQYDRLIKRLAGTTVASVAATGYDLKGSMLEVLNDNLTQAQLDKQTELFNIDIEKRQALSQAGVARLKGKQAGRSALISAFSTLLTQGNQWYQQYGGFGKATTAPMYQGRSVTSIPAPSGVGRYRPAK